MRIDSFEYTDAKSKVTQRVVAITKLPSSLIEGIDVTELPSEAVQEFALAYNAALDRFKQDMLNLQVEFDLVHNLRNFKPENITNKETQYV